MSIEQHEEFADTFRDMEELLRLLLEPDAFDHPAKRQFIIAMAERLVQHVAQCRKDLRQSALRHAICDAPEEVPS